MGPIEYALVIEAFRLQGVLKANYRPVKPALDCMAQAIREACEGYGFSAEMTTNFLLRQGSRIHSLDEEINDRQEFRAIERRMLCLIGREGNQDRLARRGRRPQV
ncbi:hypothetical protein IFHNHDMJ_01641 [Synechococcus sp. CBW1107]|uniref:hypothetical protein n=2 Tax=unclassified Synechococcus TaxID=2626047 RepID=UPI0030885448|nr:hypothetical protein IFHNHDMJ_01641 [Synechococcus sp. CBW1107]